jgi:Xaa-Pro dipeptidase
MTTRVERTVQLMRQRGIDALWIEPSANFLYLFGFELLSLERLCGVLVTSSGDLRAIVPLMHAGEFEVSPGIELFTWTDSDGPENAAAACLKGIKRLLVARGLPAWALFLLRNGSGAEVELDTNVLTALRVRKDAQEIEALRRAAAVTDDVIEWISTQVPECSTEAELATRIKARYLEHGHDEMIALVASGPNAALAHYLGGDHSIHSDQPLLIDIGARIGDYWSDTTRVFFSGDDPIVQDVYGVVVGAYEAALAAVEVGVECQDVDRAARTVIEDAGYGDHFTHRTGHGLGLEVHEPPFLRSGDPAPLEVGNVFTIEPGVYLPGRFGLRYENTVVLGADGPEELNKTPPIHSL